MSVIEKKMHAPACVYRDFQRDFPSNLADQDDGSFRHQIVRVGVVALPFLSLYRPLGAIVNFVGNLSRLQSSGQELLLEALGNKRKTKMAASALNTAVFASALPLMTISPVLGMALITTHDTAVYSGHLYKALKGKKYKKAFESCAHIFTSAIYLSLFFTASAQMIALSFAAQILLGAYQSSEEFSKGEGHYLEGMGQLAMCAVRVHQMQPHIKQWQFEQQLRKVLADLPETYFVGELGENWEFPSDHLPVGALVNGKHIGTWNVLDTQYIDWVIERNDQGIKGGAISRLNRESSVMKGLTVREVLVLHQVVSMVDRPDRPFQILALQECNTQFIKGLQCLLPEHIGIIQQNPKLRDQEIVLFNKNDFTFLKNESFTAVAAFPSAPGKLVLDLVFEERHTGEKFQIICAHIPGNPALPGRQEFAEYAVSHKRQDAITIGLGDMNFTPSELGEAFAKAERRFNSDDHFENKIFYYTNVDPYTKAAKNIDQIWIAGAHTIEADLPDQVLPGLQQTVTQLLPNARELEMLYDGEKIDYIRFMSERWRLYLERLREWEKISQLAAE